MKTCKLFFTFLLIISISTASAQINKIKVNQKKVGIQNDQRLITNNQKLTIPKSSVGLSAPTNNTLDVVVQDDNGNLSYIAWTGKSWSKWKKLEGEMNPNHPIQTISVENGRTEIVAVTKTNALVHAFLKNKKLSEWKPLVIFPGSTPKLVSWGPGRLDILTTNKKGEIIQTYFTRGKWSKRWKNIGGNVRENQSPSVVAQAKGKLDIFYRSKEGLIKHKSWNKNSWTGWRTVPGMRLLSPVVAASMSNGRLDLFTNGDNGEIMHSSKGYSDWTEWTNIGGDMSIEKGIHVHKRGGVLDIFYINESNQLLHKIASSKGKSNWSVITNKAIQLPSTTSWSPNRTDISFLNDKGELQQAYFNGRKWSSLRNKGKLKFETMVVKPPTSDVLIAFPSFDKFKLKYPEKYKISTIQPVDSDTKSLDKNKNNNQSETTDNGWIESDNGIFCRTFTIEAEDDDRLENKIIGDVPAGIVPGTIMQKDVFVNSNYNLVWDAPVKRKSFNITNTSPNYANDVIDTIPSRRSFITYAQINAEIDKKWRKRRKSGEYHFVTGDYQFYRNNNVERLLFELGISANYLSAKTKFSLKKKKYRYGETYIGYQENIYFTAIASDDGNGWLEEGQNTENLLLVEKVTYGRQLLIKIEKKIEKDSINYSAQFDANFIGNYNAEVESEKATENTEYTITTYALGGNELEGFIPIGVYTGRYANLREALTAVDAKRQFNSSNRGYPISYELKDLHSNTPQKFRYSTPEIVEKPLCIPLFTDYIIRIKKARIQEGSQFGDTGRKLEIWGDINVTLDGRNIGNLITGTKELGSNPYAKNPNAKKQIKVPGTIPISLDNSVWEYSPGFIADGNRKNDLPRFRLTRSILDRDFELNFDAELKEIDPQNRNENFPKVTATVNLRKLVALNPSLHDFGGDETLVFDLTDNRVLEFVVEFIPIDSSAERLPIIAFDEEDSGDASIENDIGIIEENGINTSADISSSLQYVITDDGVCLCHIEKSDILDYEFNINNSSSSIAPGTIFKLSNFIKENNPFLDQTLPDGIRRGPIDLTIENLTSVGRQDSISGFFIPAFKKGNTQSIAISNEITKALVNNRNDIYATANSNVNVITTKNARQAAFAAGLSVNTAFVDADLDFFKSTSSSNETIFAIIKRNFFKVSARPTAISPFKGNYTWAFSGDYDVEQEEGDYSDTGTFSSTQNNSYDFQLEILRRLQLNPIVNRRSADNVLQTEGYAYVGEVTYGELAIIKFETSYSESETDLKTRIESQFMGIGGSVNTEYNLFRSDSTTNVEAMYYGFNSEIARHITNEEEVKELFNDLTNENNMFNPEDPFIGIPLSFKAFQVGSNKIIGNFAVDQNITSNYFCSEKNMRIELKLINFKPFGDWNDRGRGIEIIGEIIPFFILDEGRVIANEDNKLLFTDGSRIKLESNLSQNSEPTSIPSSAAPEIDLLFDNTIVSAGLTYKDIINGKMYLQFNLSEHDSGDENEKFLYVSEEIPIYELIPEKGTNKEIKIKAKYKHKNDTYLEFTLKVERP